MRAGADPDLHAVGARGGEVGRPGGRRHVARDERGVELTVEPVYGVDRSLNVSVGDVEDEAGGAGLEQRPRAVDDVLVDADGRPTALPGIDDALDLSRLFLDGGEPVDDPDAAQSREGDRGIRLRDGVHRGAHQRYPEFEVGGEIRRQVDVVATVDRRVLRDEQHVPVRVPGVYIRRDPSPENGRSTQSLRLVDPLDEGPNRIVPV